MSFARAIAQLRAKEQIRDAYLDTELAGDISEEKYEMERVDQDIDLQMEEWQRRWDADELKRSSIGAGITGVAGLASGVGLLSPMGAAVGGGLLSKFMRDKVDPYAQGIAVKYTGPRKFHKTRREGQSNLIASFNQGISDLVDAQSLLDWTGGIQDALNIYRLGETFTKEFPASGADDDSLYSSLLTIPDEDLSFEMTGERFRNIYNTLVEEDYKG